jgi:putative nucleotidyltransferase with HDIG domain
MLQLSEANPAVESFVKRHQAIQVLPETTLRILRLIRDPRCDATQLRKLLEQDAALSARILKAVNSSYYSLQSKVTGLDRAVAYMGIKAVKELVVSSSLAVLCKSSQDIGHYNTREVWDHSVAVAIFSRELAVRTGAIDPEDAFLAGMLHDVGLLLEVQSDPEKCMSIFNTVDATCGVFAQVEQSTFGFDHCQLGHQLAQIWKFPEYVTAVTQWHHSPEEAPEEFQAFCRHVFLADTQCCLSRVGFPLTASCQEVTDEAIQSCGASREAFDEITAKLPILLRLHLS